MAEALANSFTHIIPKELAGFWGLVIALISAPGTFFISNDGFYFGVLPVLAEAGRAYGFTNMQMALASLMGQAFHLIKPIGCLYLLAVTFDWIGYGSMAKESAKYALGIFVIFIVTIVLLGSYAALHSTIIFRIDRDGSSLRSRPYFY